MTTNLTRYNQNFGDRNTAAHDESLLGHYVEEQGWTVKEALENLAPIAKQTYAQTVSVANTSKWLAVAGGVIGLIGGGTVGLIGALPIGAAAMAFFAYRDAQQCISRREVELRALKNCPNLLELMYGCHLRGAETRNLIAAWDIFLDNYAQSGSCDANLMAREYLRILDGLSFTIDQNGEVPIPQALPESKPPTTAIGNQTRLGAVEVPSQPVQPKTLPTGLSQILSDPYQSRAFFGAQRTGKSYLAAVASKEIADRLGAKIYHMNLASFGEEDSYYWQHATETIRGDLSSLDGYTAKQIIGDAIGLVKRFYSQQNAILIVDEISYLGSTGNQHADLLKPLLTMIADKITTLASSGKKRQQAIWTIAPEFVAGSLTQDAKAVKKLELTYVSIHPSKKVDWNGQAIGFDWSLFNQIKANFAIDETTGLPNSDRICFVGRHWLPLGELPDLKKQPNQVISDPVQHLERSLEASDQADDSELIIRTEIKRFLLANGEGSKPRDLARNARQPVRGMSTEDIKLYLEVMALDGEIYEVDGTFFTNSN